MKNIIFNVHAIQSKTVELVLTPKSGNQCFDSLNKILCDEKLNVGDEAILADLQAMILGQLELKNLRGVYREVA